MTTGSLITSKLPLAFSTLSLGATDLVVDGPIILDDMIFVLDLLK